jgi:hypothetical protein
MLLGLLGFTALPAFSGPEAVRLAGEWLPDVVVCDIRLPGIDGYEVARRLRHWPGLEQVVLVAVSGLGERSGASESTTPASISTSKSRWKSPNFSASWEPPAGRAEAPTKGRSLSGGVQGKRVPAKLFPA